MSETPENTVPQSVAKPVLQPASQPSLPDPWAGALPFTCSVSLALPVPKFKVRDLLTLDRGSIVETRWKEGSHLPLLVNSKQVGWVEFEVAGDHVAVQVTELL